MFLLLIISFGILLILLVGGYAEEQAKEAWQEQRKADRRRNARFAEEFSKEAERIASIQNNKRKSI